MKKKQIIILSISLFLITIALLGLAYAYYKTKIVGNNTDKSISSLSKKLEITYTDGNGVIKPTEQIEPGYTVTKTFSVENTGDEKANYSIKLNGKNETKIVEVSTYSNAINIVDKFMYYLNENEEGNVQVYRIRTNGQDNKAM